MYLFTNSGVFEGYLGVLYMAMVKIPCPGSKGSLIAVVNVRKRYVLENIHVQPCKCYTCNRGYTYRTKTFLAIPSRSRWILVSMASTLLTVWSMGNSSNFRLLMNDGIICCTVLSASNGVMVSASNGVTASASIGVMRLPALMRWRLPALVRWRLPALV